MKVEPLVVESLSSGCSLLGVWFCEHKDARHSLFGPLLPIFLLEAYLAASVLNQHFLNFASIERLPPRK